MSFKSSKAQVPPPSVIRRQPAVEKAARGRKSPLAKERPIRSACNDVVEALEQRQLLSGTGWIVSVTYGNNNQNAGTDGRYAQLCAGG